MIWFFLLFFFKPIYDVYPYWIDFNVSSKRFRKKIQGVSGKFCNNAAKMVKKIGWGNVGAHGHWFQRETSMSVLKNLLKMSKFVDHYILKLFQNLWKISSQIFSQN